jgi:lipid II:glycine glycyltransferase (peptidoglycan interpeptide bridge formation enzyme)
VKKQKYEFREVGEGEWAEFAAAWKPVEGEAEVSFFQTVERKRKREKMGYTNYILGVYEGEKLAGGGILLGRGGEFWMAYGPVLDYSNKRLVEFFLKELAGFAREKKMMRVEVFPNLLMTRRTAKGETTSKYVRYDIFTEFSGAGFKYEGETIKYQMKAGRWAFVKDLTGIFAVEDLRATYRKTLRQRLKKVEGKLVAEELPREKLSILVDLIDTSDAHNGVKGRDLEYYEKMFDAFGGKAKFVVARKADDGTPVAGAIFVYNGREVVSYLSGVNREYRELSGRAWLQDYIMGKIIGTGITRVNFFWVEGDFSGKNGLLEFKSGFGGEVEEYIGGFEMVLRPVAWFLVRARRKLSKIFRK